jgi:putative spermidine/putrescine transport system substrate-binding protein
MVKTVKLLIVIALTMVFSVHAGTAFAGGLSSEQIAERLKKFKGETLTVVSWGGSYQAAQRNAYFKPFAEEFGINVVEDSPAGSTKIMAMVKSGKVTWDVVAGSSYYGDDLGEQGFLEPIDYSIVDKTDFIGKFGGKYHVGTDTYSTVLAYRTDAFPPGKGPTKVTDLWDVKKFPGRRSIQDDVMDNITWGLLAAGYSLDNIYPLTDEKVEKAFKKLDELKPHITKWWTGGAQPPQLLTDKEVVMATAWNGRVQAIKDEGVPVKIIWNEATLQGDSFMIPKGAPHKDLAMLFVAWQSRPENNYRTSNYISYGPINKKAIPKVTGKYKGSLPTDHTEVQVLTDFEWWATDKNYTKMKRQWQEWKLK